MFSKKTTKANKIIKLVKIFVNEVIFENENGVTSSNKNMENVWVMDSAASSAAICTWNTSKPQPSVTTPTRNENIVKMTLDLFLNFTHEVEEDCSIPFSVVLMT